MKWKPFERPKLKVSRARKHVAEIESEVAKYLSRDPSAIVVTIDDQSKKHGLLFGQSEAIPFDIALIFGDAIHNLRGALDLLANDLVALNGVEPKKVYFPFADSGPGLDDQIKDKMRGASESAKDIVRSLKPYKGGNILLRALHDLDITDKHIDFIASGVSAATSSFVFERVRSDKPNQIKFEANFGAMRRVPIQGDKRSAEWPGTKVLGKLADQTVRLTIGNNLPLAGSPVIETLHQLVGLVESVIQTFEAHCLTGR